MPPSFRPLFSIVAVCALVAGVRPIAAEPPKAAAEKPRAAATSGEALKQALTKLGYTEIALERMVYGHLVVTVQVEGKDGKQDLRMIVDCGSSVTLITPDAAKALGLTTEKTGGSVGGVGGSGIAVAATKAKSLKVGSFEEKDVPLSVIDIGQVNALIQASGLKPVEGVIGSDWMLAKKAVLDVESARLFILPPTAK